MSEVVTSADTSSVPPTEAPIITLNPAAQLPLKLMPTNFNSWRSQLETLLMGLDLIGFIDGIEIAPPTTITTNNVSTRNPAHGRWFKQDTLILHALRCSISESLYPYVSAASTARDAWKILENLYASRSQSRIITLKGKLARTTKGDRDVITFVNELKLIAAELALVDDLVSDLDLVVHYLRGLGTDYNHFTAAVRARGSKTTIEDLLDSLIAYEADLKEQARLSAVPTAFFTHDQARRGGGGTHKQPHSYQQSTESAQIHQPRTSCPTNNAGAEVGPQRRARVICQYCERPGHSVRQCFKLFPQARQAHANRQAQAHHTTTTGPPTASAPWLLDSAASHHITPDLGNLSLYSDYTSPDEILVGHGSGFSHGGVAAEGGKQR